MSYKILFHPRYDVKLPIFLEEKKCFGKKNTLLQ